MSTRYSMETSRQDRDSSDRFSSRDVTVRCRLSRRETRQAVRESIDFQTADQRGWKFLIATAHLRACPDRERCSGAIGSHLHPHGVLPLQAWLIALTSSQAAQGNRAA